MRVRGAAMSSRTLVSGTHLLPPRCVGSTVARAADLTRNEPLQVSWSRWAANTMHPSLLHLGTKITTEQELPMQRSSNTPRTGQVPAGLDTGSRAGPLRHLVYPSLESTVQTAPGGWPCLPVGSLEEGHPPRHRHLQMSLVLGPWGPAEEQSGWGRAFPRSARENNKALTCDLRAGTKSKPSGTRALGPQAALNWDQCRPHTDP